MQSAIWKEHYEMFQYQCSLLLVVKNHWSIDQWHLEVYEPRYYSGSYAQTAKLFGMSKNFVLCTHATNHQSID